MSVRCKQTGHFHIVSASEILAWVILMFYGFTDMDVLNDSCESFLLAWKFLNNPVSYVDSRELSELLTWAILPQQFSSRDVLKYLSNFSYLSDAKEIKKFRDRVSSDTKKKPVFFFAVQNNMNRGLIPRYCKQKNRKSLSVKLESETQQKTCTKNIKKNPAKPVLFFSLISNIHIIIHII